MTNQRFAHAYLPFFLCILFFSQNAALSQNCFGNGTLSGWSFWEGERKYNGTTDYLIPVSQPNPVRISAYTASSNGIIYPDDICTASFSWVPLGFSQSIRIGNSNDGSQIDRAAYTILVDSSNAYVQMSLFVAMEFNDDHNINVQPKFDIHIKDESGNDIDCGYFNVVAGYNVPGFETQPGGMCSSGKPIEYLPWKAVSIDLTPYIGENITFEFTSYDCSHNGHFGFGLVAIKCQEAKITSSVFCPGVSGNITLYGPPGFGNYQWSNDATTQDITIQNPQPGQTYWVKFKPYSNLSGNCQSYLEFKIPNGYNIIPQPVVQFCQNASVELTTNAPTGSTYSWLPDGQTSATITAYQPGDYIVEVANGDCKFRDTVHAEQIDPPQHNVQTTNPTCAGLINGSPCVTLTNSQQQANFAWSTGQNTACADALAVGTYAVTVTEIESPLHCSLMSSVIVTEPPAISSQTTLLRLPHCKDWDEGQASTTVAGGTPPYQILWSNGATGQQADILDEGLYGITVTDANGCPMFDSIEVPRLRFSLKKKDNVCPKGQEGEISIEIHSGVSPYQYRLVPGDFGLQPVFTGLTSGIYEVEVKVPGCELSDFIEIKDLRDEFFQILPSFSPNDTVEMGKPLLIEPNFNYPPDGIHYLTPPLDSVIYFDDWRMEFIPGNSGEVKIFGTDIYGCPDTASARFVVLKVRDVYIPNIFSPHGTYENQQFKPFFKENQIRKVELFQVHDRWGTLMFQAKDFQPNDNDPARSWDGKYHGKEMPPAVYAYFVQVQYIDGEVITYKGDVTLYR